MACMRFPQTKPLILCEWVYDFGHLMPILNESQLEFNVANSEWLKKKIM